MKYLMFKVLDLLILSEQFYVGSPRRWELKKHPKESNNRKWGFVDNSSQLPNRPFVCSSRSIGLGSDKGGVFFIRILDR